MEVTVCSKCSSIYVAYTFSISRKWKKVRNRTIILHNFPMTHFFKSQVGSRFKSHDLFQDLLIISLISTSETDQKYFEHFPIKPNIGFHGGMADSTWNMKNYFIFDDCCFPNKEIAELVCQEIGRGKIWKIFIFQLLPIKFLVNLKFPLIISIVFYPCGRKTLLLRE